MSALKILDGVRLVPVVNIDDISQAIPLAETLLAAGIGAIEVTLRTDCGLAAIAAIRKAVPGIVVGAGSIRQVVHVKQVLAAGAQFGVSPGAPDYLLEEVARLRLPFVPGAATATEAMTLAYKGFDLIKFFPAERLGGLAALSAIAAPLPEIRFFPTGGIDAEKAPIYLRHTSVVCVGGSWFVPGDLLAAGNYEAIGKLASAASAICKQD